MKTDTGRALVTGGAGFIGSHLVDRLMEHGWKVTVLDNLSNGSKENLSRWTRHPNLRFIEGDVTDEDTLDRTVRGVDVVFHLAANPEVRLGDPRIHFQQNLYATYLVLEACRRHGVKKFVFTSSSTVYGEASKLPTPESYGPLKPISVYGAAKLAAEALISGYSFTFKIRSLVFRLANIVGSRAKHGVIVDFIRKLRANPRRLEVLGDGSQTKSYLLVEDCVEAILTGFRRGFRGLYEVYNVGSEDTVDVKTIASTVVEEMGLKDVEIVYTGGVEGGRGWVGDVKRMWLDISKIKGLGWKPSCNSLESVRIAARRLKKEV